MTVREITILISNITHMRTQLLIAITNSVNQPHLLAECCNQMEGWKDKLLELIPEHRELNLF